MKEPVLNSKSKIVTTEYSKYTVEQARLLKVLSSQIDYIESNNINSIKIQTDKLLKYAFKDISNDNFINMKNFLNAANVTVKEKKEYFVVKCFSNVETTFQGHSIIEFSPMFIKVLKHIKYNLIGELDNIINELPMFTYNIKECVIYE